MTTQVNGKTSPRLGTTRGRISGALSAGGQAGLTAAGEIRDAAAAAAAAARAAAGTVAAAAPEIAGTTGQAVTVAMRGIDRGSDEVLLAGSALTLGLTLGLLIAGANRYLAVVALIPATAMGLTLLGRRASPAPRGRSA